MSFAMGVGVLLIGFALGWITCAVFCTADRDDDPIFDAPAEDRDDEDWRHG